MLTDLIAGALTNTMNSAMGALPGLQVSINIEAVTTLLTEIVSLDDWLPITEFCQAVGFCMSVWTAKQLLGLALKAIEVIKP